MSQVDERNALHAGVGIFHHGIENTNTTSVYFAFQKDFIPKSLIEIRAAYAAPVDLSVEEEMTYFQSFHFDMNFLFKVLDERKQTFKTGIGFSAGLYDIEDIMLTQEDETRIEFLPGFSVVAEYNFILPSQWLFGVRTNLYRYDANRRGWFLGAVLGYRF